MKRDFALIKHSHALGELLDLDLAGVVDNSLIQYDAVSGDWQDVTIANVNGQLDHGLLLGLSDDDHPQYELVSALTEDVQDIIGAALTDSTSIDFSYNDGSGTITAVVLPAGVNHNLLLNYVADQHVAHTGVVLTAGAGLTGGGDISASRTFDIGAGTGITVNANDVAISAAYLGANPTASVGLTAVNGSATSYMRSDGAPALDQGIIPTWTGTHTWTDNDEVRLGTGGDLRLYHDGTDSRILNGTGTLIIESTGGPIQINNLITTFTNTGGPLFRWIDGDAGADAKVAEWRNNTGVVTLAFRDDSQLNPVTAMSFHRTGTTPTFVRLPNDNEEFQLGASQDLRILHDGTNSIIRNDTGVLQFNMAGTVRLSMAQDGRFFGGALHNNAGAMTGATNQYVGSGTYTPTLTNATNVAASTARQSQWMRVGNVVTVSGQVDVDPTAAGATELGISLPIASALTTAFQLGGTGNSSVAAGEEAMIDSDATNDRARMRWVAVDVTNHTYAFTFSYEVL